MASEPYSEPALAGTLPGGEPGFPAGDSSVQGRSPWYLAYKRLMRNRIALASLGLFIAIVLFCLAAPLWATKVAHTGPNTVHTTEKIDVDGKPTNVVAPDGTPLHPVYFGASGKFFFGADGRLGRDEMVRLMYGGRTTLYIGLMSALVTTILSVALGLIAAYYGGWADSIISRILDVIWAFPVLLLGAALATALAVSSGLRLGPITIPEDSLWITILIIGFVYTPYMARPIRGEVLALREKEFVEAAVAQGAGPMRVMFGELLPNLWSTIIVFFTLNIANNMLLESALSFLNVGVRAPQSSWGSLISKGFELIYSAPWLTIIPGLMILLTVLSLNVFGDGLRDALDPKAKIRLEAHSGQAEAPGAVEVEGV